MKLHVQRTYLKTKITCYTNIIHLNFNFPNNYMYKRHKDVVSFKQLK